MANLATNHDIICDALFMTGELPDITSSPSVSDYYNQAIVLLNRAHRAICRGGSELNPKIQQDWWWLRKPSPGVLTLLPSITIGTITATKGSTAVVFSTVPQQNASNVSVAGYFINFPGDNGDVYRIATHVSGATAATLDSVYTDTSGAGKSYRACCLTYTLASDLHSIIGPIRAFQASADDEISGCELNEMLADFPLNTLTFGVPKRFAMTAEQVIQFSHYAGDNGELIRLEYDYKMVPTDLADDTGSPIIPLEYRSILSDYMQGYIFGAKSDDRGPLALASAQSGLDGMNQDHINRMIGQGRNFGQIRPRQAQLLRDTPRTASGLILS